MATDPKERLLQWLRDAHAMEAQAETMLKAQSERIKHYPALEARIAEHIKETEGQKQLLEGCITRLGGSIPTMKDAAGKMMATFQGLGGAMMSDEVVKGMGISYAFEHLEQATYRALIAAADACGDAETRRVCEQILEQEEAMGRWLAENQAQVVQAFLARDAAPDTEAKR
ncbi:ferritin-like domain-containing protein [Coralloluteibacterium thermophilus]|uniref:Ferritin-like domain-containing protein n=1 Tax=Coralloluteibacterium thermophilum TaxID=2707049 RepID=A0ABV9NL53_9GAMM